MIFKVTGIVRRSHESGFGPFRRERWEEFPFEHRIAVGEEPVEIAEGIYMWPETAPFGWIISGRIGDILCHFGEIEERNPKAARFDMRSVRSVVVTGTAELQRPPRPEAVRGGLAEDAPAQDSRLRSLPYAS